MINQEYYLRDGNHYVPDEGFQDYGLTDVEILPKKDGSQGVSVYDKGSLVAHIEGKSTNNDILTVYKEDGTVYIDLDDEKIMPRVFEGEGIIIGKEFDTNRALISIDKDYIKKITKLNGRNGIIVTENVDDLLQSHTARTMLANSEFIVMLNQAATDRTELAKLLSISDTQMSYITNVGAGQGLLKVGSSLVPFINKFPTDTKLYKLMTTKPGEDK